MWALHFVNDGIPSTDLAYKIRPISDCINLRFSPVYAPKYDLSFDETLLLIKGRMVFRQYIPKKGLVLE